MSWIKGVIIGVILGFISSFAFISMNIKKRQRDSLFPVIATIMTLFGAVFGGRVGYNLERSDKISKALGLDKLQYSHIKVGRFWESKTIWIDVKGFKHSLRTSKASTNSVSYYNGTLITNHGSSASSINISKYHEEARKIIFTRLREKYGEDYIKYLGHPT